MDYGANHHDERRQEDGQGPPIFPFYLLCFHGFERFYVLAKPSGFEVANPGSKAPVVPPGFKPVFRPVSTSFKNTRFGRFLAAMFCLRSTQQANEAADGRYPHRNGSTGLNGGQHAFEPDCKPSKPDG